MRKTMIKMAMLVVVIATFASCTTLNHSMREPNTRVNFTKSDFTLSEQVSAEDKTVKILGIDFERLFKKETGVVDNGASSISLANMPVIGNVLYDKTSNYALYNLMFTNPGYDVIFYPQYETKISKPVLGLGFIVKITKVKTTARLGKLKE
ncbi:MAG: hypothetical protein K9I70_08570 [Chitinophagaceae bacterium]|nr:hypothetical protein [Chitinophagaceae bacterium]